MSIMQQFADTTGLPCKYNAWKWINTRSGEVAKFCCNSWDCADCRTGMSLKYAGRMSDGNPTQMITITMVPQKVAECRLKWSQFIRALRHGYGKYPKNMEKLKKWMDFICAKMQIVLTPSQWTDVIASVRLGTAFEYFRVLERGMKSGMRHYHLLIRGPRLIHLVVVSLAALFGFGYIGDVRQVYDQVGAGGYLAKYLTKSGGETGWRKVGSSRRWRKKILVDGEADWVLAKSGQGIPLTSQHIHDIMAKRLVEGG